MAASASYVNPKFHFDNNTCVVSLLNTGSAWLGHAVIVVESKKGGQLFVGQYEVYGKILKEPVDKTWMDTTQSLMGNKQGYIGKIRVIETDRYTDSDDLSKFSSKSWYAKPESVQKMIDSIKRLRDELEETKRQIKAHMKAMNDLPAYQIAGSYRTPVLGGNGGESCITWAENRLREAGIEPDSSWWDYIKAIPEKHVGSSCEIQ